MLSVIWDNQNTIKIFKNAKPFDLGTRVGMVVSGNYPNLGIGAGKSDFRICNSFYSGF